MPIFSRRKLLKLIPAPVLALLPSDQRSMISMTRRYDTGNPVDSTDSRDMFDNAANFDLFSAGNADEYRDRLGRPRLTIPGFDRRARQALDQYGGVRPTGDYEPGKAYIPGDLFMSGGVVYIATREFVSVSLDQDMAAGNAAIYQGVTRDQLENAQNPSQGAGMIGRVGVSVSSVRELVSMPEIARKIDARYLLLGFHDGTWIGGGFFFWSPDHPKSEHDGGTVIDPDRAYPVTWPSEEWFEAAPGGTGCFVRCDALAELRAEWYGAIPATDSSMSFSAAINRAKRNTFRTEVTATPGEYLIDGTLPEWDEGILLDCKNGRVRFSYIGPPNRVVFKVFKMESGSYSRLHEGGVIGSVVNLNGVSGVTAFRCIYLTSSSFLDRNRVTQLGSGGVGFEISSIWYVDLGYNAVHNTGANARNGIGVLITDDVSAVNAVSGRWQINGCRDNILFRTLTRSHNSLWFTIVSEKGVYGIRHENSGGGATVLEADFHVYLEGNDVNVQWGDENGASTSVGMINWRGTTSTAVDGDGAYNFFSGHHELHIKQMTARTSKLRNVGATVKWIGTQVEDSNGETYPGTSLICTRSFVRGNILHFDDVRRYRDSVIPYQNSGLYLSKASNIDSVVDVLSSGARLVSGRTSVVVRYLLVRETDGYVASGIVTLCCRPTGQWEFRELCDSGYNRSLFTVAMGPAGALVFSGSMSGNLSVNVEPM